jgi:transcriptional regulator with XRE-family HTH domain
MRFAHQSRRKLNYNTVALHFSHFIILLKYYKLNIGYIGGMSSRRPPVQNSDDAFGALLFLFRQRAGLTQSRLAKKSEYSKGYVSGRENSRLCAPPPQAVDRLARVLCLNEAEAAQLHLAARRERADQVHFPRNLPPHILEVAARLRCVAPYLLPRQADRLKSILKAVNP